MSMIATSATDLPSALSDLASLPRWVGWKWETRDGKRTKVPKGARNKNASTSRPDQWVTHDHAAMWTQCDGVGFVLTGAPSKDIAAIDLDHVRDPATGTLLDWARELVDRAGTYCEITPSGTGLRLIGTARAVVGSIDRRVKHPGGGAFELYANPGARFITVTGDLLPGAPDRRSEMSEPFLELLNMASPATAAPSSHHATLFAPATDINPDDLDPATFIMISQCFEGEDRSETFMRVVGDLKEQGYGPASIAKLMEIYPDGPGLQKYGRRLKQEVIRAWHKAAEPPPLVIEEPVAVTVESDLPPHDPETGEVISATALAIGNLPEHLTKPGGMLGEIIDWIEDTSRRPNRALALGAAITTLGTIAGRRLLGPTRSGLHLYAVALAPSGSGKDHPLRQAGRLVRAVSADLVGPDEFVSMPAFINFVSRKPQALCLMDEIGTWFRRLGDHRASSYEKALSKCLRTYWGVSGDFVATPEWAGKESIDIFSPSLSIFGVSTPDEFYESLQGGDVINGFLNRFLLLPSTLKAPDRDPVCDPQMVPRGLAERLVRLYRRLATLTTEELHAPVGAPLRQSVIAWGDGARGVFEDLKYEVAKRAVGEAEPYYARTVEMAVRMATIAAVGEADMPVVSRANMEWAGELALWAAGRMAVSASGFIAENEGEKQFNRIMRLIERHDGTMTHRELLRALKGGIKSRDLADMMKTMSDAGFIEVTRSVPATGGPPTFRYRRVR